MTKDNKGTTAPAGNRPPQFTDRDAAMSRRIFWGFLVIAGGLLALLAIPRVLEFLQ